MPIIQPLNEPTRLNLLTFSRFLAAMGVVIFHAGHSAIFRWNALAGELFSYGYIFVGFFYVLSGFVLTYAFGHTPLDLRKFYVARIARIYPAYALALFLMIGPFLLRIHQGEYPPLRLVASLVTVPTMLQAWFPLTAQAWNYPAWSVSAELFFYLMFPFALSKIWKRPGSPGQAIKTWLLSIAACWLLSLLPSLLYLWLNPDQGLSPQAAEQHWQSVLYFSPLLRLPEFLAGIALGCIFANRSGYLSRSPRIYTSLFSIVCSLAALPLLLLFKPGYVSAPLLHNGLLLPIWACLIYGLAEIEANGFGFAIPSFLVLLGEASYGIYILQTPTSNLFKAAVKVLTGQSIKGEYSSIWLLSLYCAILVAISIVSFKFFESPARSYIRNLFTSRLQDRLSPELSKPCLVAKSNVAG